MSPNSAFHKYSGTGNTFAFFRDLQETPLSLAAAQSLAIDTCTEHQLDGIAIWKYAHNKIFFGIINADGSYAEICGNALRCLGLELAACGLWVSTSSKIYSYFNPSQEVIATIENVKDVHPDYLQADVTISMASPSAIQLLKVENASASFIQLANPHLVIENQEFSFFDSYRFEKYGSDYQSETWQKMLKIPKCNIGFLCDVKDKENKVTARLTVYERGAGLTQACGSGAVAASVYLLQSHPKANVFKYQVPGGELCCVKEGERWLLSGKVERIS